MPRSDEPLPVPTVGRTNPRLLELQQLAQRAVQVFSGEQCTSPERTAELFESFRDCERSICRGEPIMAAALSALPHLYPVQPRVTLQEALLPPLRRYHEIYEPRTTHAPPTLTIDVETFAQQINAPSESLQPYQREIMQSMERYMASDMRMCRICDERYYRADGERIDGRNVCDSCIEGSEHVVTCDDDGEHHLRENVYYHEGDDCFRAYPVDEDDSGDSDDDCYPVDDDDSGDSDDDSDTDMGSESVYSYSTNVLAVRGNHCYVNGKRDTIGKQLLFGVELETDTRRGETRDSIASALLETSFRQFGICKSDGTVSGPECVTLPADIESHRKLYGWRDWIKVLQPIAQGYYGESCGMHVHINRRALSPLTVGKMLVFMNDRANREWLSMIAQRDFAANSYCKQKTDKRLPDGRHANDDRYECLNVTRHTVEVRIFRSNLHAERLLKNIEFCHALTQWARDASASELTADAMQSYVFANRGLYPMLAKFIDSKLNIETTERE